MPRKVIVDTDPGVDDILTLLLLLASPEISIELISVTFGNTTLDHAFLNVLKLYNVARRHLLSCEPSLDPLAQSRTIFPNLVREKPTLLARGASGPIKGLPDLAEYFHGIDGLSNISETNPEFKADPEHPDEALSITSTHASEAILKVLASEPPNTVTILSLGPLSTVAMALQKDPQTFARVAKVVSMGGALDVPGNTSPTAEFNFFADPFAAEIVMRAATKGIINMALLPLDITTRHVIHFDKLIRTPTIKTLEGNNPSILRDFLDAILSRPRKVSAELGFYSDEFAMHDPLAGYYVIDKAMDRDNNNKDNSERWELRRRTFLMERMGEWTKGSCIVDRRGTKEIAGAVRSRDGISHEEADVRVEHHGLDIMVVTESPGLPEFEALFLSRVVNSAK